MGLFSQLDSQRCDKLELVYQKLLQTFGTLHYKSSLMDWQTVYTVKGIESAPKVLNLLCVSLHFAEKLWLRDRCFS